MTTYKVQGPDGAVHLFQGPDGASPDQVLSVAQKQFSPTQTPQPSPSQPQSPGFVQNTLTDAGQVASGIGQSIAHPVTALKTLLNLPIGLGEKIARTADTTIQHAKGNASYQGPVGPQENALNQVLQHYKQAYGSKESAVNTAKTKPISTLLDLSALLSGGETALGTASDVAKIAGIGDTANALGKASSIAGTAADVTNPINAVTKGAGMVASGIGKGTGAIIGNTLGVSTGAGGKAIAEAINSTQEFLDAMRGKTSPENILSNASQGLQNIRDARQADYLGNISDATKTGMNFDLSPIKGQLDTTLNDLKVSVGKDGSLDFSQSPIKNEASAIKALETAHKDISNIKSNDFSTLYTLKQQLGDLLPNNPFTAAGYNRAQGAIGTIQKSIDSQLHKVPGYSDAMGSYSKYSDVLKQFQRAIGRPDDPTAAIQAYNKLQNLFKSDDALKQQYAKILNDSAGGNIGQQIAGARFNSLTPQTGVGKLVASGEMGVGALTALFHNPAIAGGAFASLPFTVPRLVGEGLAKVGQGAKIARKGVNAVKPAASLTTNPLIQTLLKAASSSSKQ